MTPLIAYVCDQKACPYCSWPLCRHTLDICHAVNFKKVVSGDEKYPDRYMEKEDSNAN